MPPVNRRNPDFSNDPASSKRPHFDFDLRQKQISPIISIITPFFNTGEIFHQTIRSIRRQTFQNWEWIIVDDASTDDRSKMILAEIAESDRRVKIYHLAKNSGPSRARNFAVSKSKCNYIFQLDSDDLIEPTTLEKLLWFLETNPNLYFAKGLEIGFGSQSYFWDEGFHSRDLFLQHNCVQTNSLVRRSVFDIVGGYDEANLHGLEDWEFWLSCAYHGIWGDTVHEYLHWYRRRDNHHETWQNFDNGVHQNKFKVSLKERHSRLWDQGFPNAERQIHAQYASINFTPPFENPLKKKKRRLLFLIPHFEMGGADKFNIDLTKQLTKRFNWEVSILALSNAASDWTHLFEEITPDVFSLHKFISLPEFPRFLLYFIKSRYPDAILVSNATLGYQFIPLIKSEFPEIPIFDYIHMEETYWKSGGYPRFSINHQTLLTKTIVNSNHLKEWLVQNGHSAESIETVYINVDPQYWSRTHQEKKHFQLKWKLQPGIVTILYAGRFCEQKQPDVFAQVVRNLHKSDLPFQVLVAGKGPDQKIIDDLVLELGPTVVTFAGSVQPTTMRELIIASDIFFLPSKMEGIALVFFESMSTGVVPVGAAVGGQQELITPNCGYLINPDSQQVSKYTQILEHLIRAPRKIAKIGRAAQERIQKNFYLNKMGDEMNAILDFPHSLRPDTHVHTSFAQLHTIEVIEQQRLSDNADRLWIECKEHRNKVSLPKPKSSLVIYLQADSGYSEQNTVTAEYDTYGENDIWIELPADSTSKAIRIDLLDNIATFYIRGLFFRIKSPINESYWAACKQADFSKIRAEGTSLLTTSEEGIVQISYGTDPQLILPAIPPPVSDKPILLQIQFRVGHNLDTLLHQGILRIPPKKKWKLFPKFYR